MQTYAKEEMENAWPRKHDTDNRCCKQAKQELMVLGRLAERAEGGALSHLQDSRQVQLLVLLQNEMGDLVPRLCRLLELLQHLPGNRSLLLPSCQHLLLLLHLHSKARNLDN